MLSDKVKDILERILWTMVSAALGAIPVALADLPPMLLVPITGAINWLLIQVRERAPWLPGPGEGLPGLRATGSRTDAG